MSGNKNSLTGQHRFEIQLACLVQELSPAFNLIASSASVNSSNCVHRNRFPGDRAIMGPNKGKVATKPVPAREIAVPSIFKNRPYYTFPVRHIWRLPSWILTVTDKIPRLLLSCSERTGVTIVTTCFICPHIPPRVDQGPIQTGNGKLWMLQSDTKKPDDPIKGVQFWG
jgi:hypothetical protein